MEDYGYKSFQKKAQHAAMVNFRRENSTDLIPKIVKSPHILFSLNYSKPIGV